MKIKKEYFRRVRRFLSPALAVIFLTAAIGQAATGQAAPDAEEKLSPQTRRELNLARQATARYHDIDRALADGYIDIDVYFPMMGYHYLRPGLLDAEFDPARPELLVYADFGDGRRRLAAVEYAVPLALSETPPEGFTGEADQWHRSEAFGLWTLHAWIWYPNPDGVFAADNPRVP